MTLFHTVNSAQKFGINLLQMLKGQKLIYFESFKELDFYKAKLCEQLTNLKKSKRSFTSSLENAVRGGLRLPSPPSHATGALIQSLSL